MSEPQEPEELDVADLVAELCARAGVEYHRTRSILVTPSKLTITFDELETNEDGVPYFDFATQDVAHREVTFRIRT